jgi:protein-L-isoaspartate(D-aspartate) O-methyltransferase
LEVGTGSGYQAAVLAELVEHVYSIEIICELADTARAKLEKLNYKNITIRCGDGYQGWAEHAPFDMIIVTAAPNHVPEPLKKQLGIGGRLVIPVGDYYQELLTITRTSSDKFTTKMVIPVRFVPMTGKAQEKK